MTWKNILTAIAEAFECLGYAFIAFFCVDTIFFTIVYVGRTICEWRENKRDKNDRTNKG